MHDVASIDLSRVLDRPKLSSFQVLVLSLCALVIVFDGFDTQAIGYVAPALLKAFSVPRSQLGPVFSAGLFGLFIGSLLISPLADRVGRKVAVIGAVALFAICSLLTITASTLHGVMLWRFITGLGLGGAIPTTLTLVSDFSPKHLRVSLPMIVALANTIGSSLGAFLAGALIPAFGWPSVFLVGGILPLLLVVVLLLYLPESPRWLLLQERSGPRLVPIVRKIDPSLALKDDAVFSMSETPLPGVPVGRLFTQGRAAMTLLIWCAFIIGYLDLYFMASWLPTLITSSGKSLQQAVAAPALLQIGGLIGGVALARLVDRYGSRTLTVTFAGCALGIMVTGAVSSEIWPLLAAVFCAGFFLISSLVGMVGYTAAYYPTAIRSSGVGWGMGMGRIGAIIGPLAAGGLIALDWSTPALFFAGGATTFIGALATFLMTRVGTPMGPTEIQATETPSAQAPGA
jgi:MFS transporter, AAHS family, 4-hydroxybenzoate transporter